MRAHAIIVRIHRIAAILFVLAFPGAMFASLRGGEPAVLVYLPIPIMLVLMITGIYQLALPWVRRMRKGRAAAIR